MPRIQNLFTLDVTPEKFIEACSDVELQETYYLAYNRLRRLEAAMEIQKDGTLKTYSRDAKIIIENTPKINDAKRLDNFK